MRLDHQNKISLNTGSAVSEGGNTPSKSEYSDDHGLAFTFDAQNIGMLDALVLSSKPTESRLLTCLVNRAGVFTVESRKLPNLQ